MKSSNPPPRAHKAHAASLRDLTDHFALLTVDPVAPCLGLRLTSFEFHAQNTRAFQHIKYQQINDYLETYSVLEKSVNLNDSSPSGVCYSTFDLCGLFPSFPISFGSQRLNAAAAPLTLKFTNTSQKPLSFNIDTPATSCLAGVPPAITSPYMRYLCALEDREVFEIHPRSAKLLPGESVDVAFIYHTKFKGYHELPILLHVKGSKYLVLSLIGVTGDDAPQLDFQHVPELTRQQQQAITQQRLQNQTNQTNVTPNHIVNLNPVPLGLSLNDSIVQYIPFYNSTSTALTFTISSHSISSFNALHHEFPIFTCLTLSATISPGGCFMSEWLFRPLECVEYLMCVDLLVRNDERELPQAFVLAAKGQLQQIFALTPFPTPSCYPTHFISNSPHLSLSTLHFGDLPPLAALSRIVLINNPTAHTVKWRVIEKHQREQPADHTQTALSVSPLDCDPLSPLLSFLPSSTVLLHCYPCEGELEPGQTIPIRLELRAGTKCAIIDADVEIETMIVDAPLSGVPFVSTPSGASPSPPRACIASSQPPPRLRAHAYGPAPAHVRLHPINQTIPLNTVSLTKRTLKLKGDLNELDSDMSDIQPKSILFTPQHIHDALLELNSIPTRATWFDQSSQNAASSHSNILSLRVLLRVLPFDVLEFQQRVRRSACVDAPLPQESLDAQTRVNDLEVYQRYFGPAQTLHESNHAHNQVHAPPQHTSTHPHTPSNIQYNTNQVLHQLVRESITRTHVGATYSHLSSTPVPYFTDLLSGWSSASDGGARAASLTRTRAAAPALTHTIKHSQHFQGVSEKVLTATIFQIMKEAVDNKFHPQQTQKVYKVKHQVKPSQGHQRTSSQVVKP